MTTEQAQAEIAKQLPALARGGAEGQQAEGRVVDIVAAQRKVSRDEAQAQVTRAKQQFAKTKNDTVATAKAPPSRIQSPVTTSSPALAASSAPISEDLIMWPGDLLQRHATDTCLLREGCRNLIA